MPKIIINRINFIMPKDLHVFAILYIRNKNIKVCENEKNDIELLSGKNIDITKPCYKCNRIQSRNFYLFKYDKNNKPVFFNSEEKDYAISFCINCINANKISRNKYWKCISCNDEFSRTKKFICVTCNTNNNIFSKIIKIVESRNVENNNMNNFIDSLCNKLQNIKNKLTQINCDTEEETVDIIYKLTNKK